MNYSLGESDLLVKLSSCTCHSLAKDVIETWSQFLLITWSIKIQIKSRSSYQICQDFKQELTRIGRISAAKTRIKVLRLLTVECATRPNSAELLTLSAQRARLAHSCRTGRRSWQRLWKLRLSSGELLSWRAPRSSDIRKKWLKMTRLKVKAYFVNNSLVTGLIMALMSKALAMPLQNRNL